MLSSLLHIPITSISGRLTDDDDDDDPDTDGKEEGCDA